MKINTNNTEKVQALVDKVEARAKVRCFFSADRVQREIKRIEKRLHELNCLKKNWKGMRFTLYSDFGRMPNAYKGTPECTSITIERGASGWFIVAASRSQMPASSQCKFHYQNDYRQFFNF